MNLTEFQRNSNRFLIGSDKIRLSDLITRAVVVRISSEVLLTVSKENRGECFSNKLGTVAASEFRFLSLERGG
jgi:hypothetical protein